MKRIAAAAAMLIAAAASLSAGSARAQGFTPSRPVEFVVHSALGGGSDVFARAVVEMVRRIRSVVGAAAGVKASGGIRTPEDARRMLLAGADRVGTSAAAAWGAALHRRLDEYLAGDDPG